MSSAPKSVAVIGAGISGLTCARELAAAGWNVTVFDKGRRPGGRMSTRQRRPSGTSDEPDWAFDHGCQFFTVKSEPFAEQVRQWQTAGVVAEWRSPVVRWVDGELQPLSTGQKLVGVPGMQSVCQHLAHSLRVNCQVQVSTISSRGNGWEVRSEHGGHGVFDRLVLAMPPAQTHGLLADVLPPADRRALFDDGQSQVSMSACWTLMAMLSRRSGIASDAVMFDSHPVLAWAARNSSKPGRPDTECWVIQATSEWSARQLELPADQVSNILREQFAVTLGGTLSLHRTDVHRWRYALGTGAAAGTRHLPGLGLGICGDWCEGDRVEAAWTSGQQLAQLLLTADR